MSIDWMTALADKLEAQTTTTWESPLDIARVITPGTIQTPALDLIDQALIDCYNTPDARLIISMPPQEGKSTRAAKDFPIWALTQNQDTRIFSASYSQRLAERNGRAIRNAIASHPELDLEIADGNSAVSDWRLQDHTGGVYSTSVGGSGSGQPADLVIIDDPIKDRKEADSQTYRDNVWDWYTDVVVARLAPGTSVVVILTRWHDDDLAGRLIAQEDSDWHFLNIPARADHRPEKGEADILGREPGEYMISARGRTQAQWAKRERESGPRTFAALYQGRPTPDSGGVFPPEEDWARYSQPMWVERPDGSRIIPGLRENGYELIQSWDMAFKDTKSSDFVVGQVWLRVGINAYLLDQIRDRLNFNATVEAVKAMTAKWPQAAAKLIEDKANGSAVISHLSKSVPGMIPIEPEGSKLARANAISPFTFAKNVILPDAALQPNVAELLGEAKAFPNSANDDTIDGLSQAVSYLLLHDLIDESELVAEEFADDAIPISYF
ncbi:MULTISPECIES: phage terminase large subunit [unclassified Brevibacterium]|uniref:phage terminase large subunit n=1 Tax=unclassified Brevibacterium TaxID=2614124 RepID=UPI001E584D86|nr:MULTISPECIES: phage terminase large subunit [unclassified Brevibacterium]MDK8436415.1 phage terminase large subunit [Brevibacterium sp. H-BE7]